MDRITPSMTGKGSSRTCWPRQILGPALNGRNMKGLEARSVFLSSMKRSGSNSSAVYMGPPREMGGVNYRQL